MLESMASAADVLQLSIRARVVRASVATDQLLPPMVYIEPKKPANTWTAHQCQRPKVSRHRNRLTLLGC